MSRCCPECNRAMTWVFRMSTTEFAWLCHYCKSYWAPCPKGELGIGEARDEISDRQGEAVSEDPDAHIRLSHPAACDPGDARFSLGFEKFIHRLGTEGRRRLIERITKIQSESS